MHIQNDRINGSIAFKFNDDQDNNNNEDNANNLFDDVNDIDDTVFTKCWRPISLAISP